MASARAERTRSEHPCHGFGTIVGICLALWWLSASAVKIAAFACPSVQDQRV